jgi:PAS domain S-box-containing protein
LNAPAGHIWIVDDSALQLERARGLLKGRYVLECFPSGEAVLERLAQGEQPDVLLLDWQMPGVSGLDVCLYLRERHDEVSLPILVQTASGAREDFASALSAGANDYLPKPYEDQELLARVATLVRVRQQAEVLRQREAWLATTLGSIGDAVITTDASGRITFLNAVAEALTGWRLREVQGQPHAAVFRILDEQTRQAVESPVNRVLREGVLTGLATQTLLIRRDKVELPIDHSAAPIRPPSGELAGAVLVFRDVTRQKDAAALLARHARHSRLVADVGQAMTRLTDRARLLQRCAEALVEHLDAALVRVWLLDGKGEELRLEASAGLNTRLDGADARVPVGQHPVGLVGLIAQRREPHLTNDLAAEPLSVDQEWADREGLSSFAGYPLLVGDRLIGVVAFFARQALPQDTLDVLRQVAESLSLGVERLHSEADRGRLLVAAEAARTIAEDLARGLRSSEERLRRVVEASGAGLWELDAATTNIRPEAHMLGLMGLPPGAPFSLEAALASIHPLDRPGVARGVESALAGEDDGRYLQTFRTIGLGDAPERWVESRGQRFLDAGGATAGVAGVAMDVTARKQAEAVSGRLLETLQRSSEFEQHLVGIVSHDLRNPLNAILLAAQLLARTATLDEKEARSVERIRLSARRASRMIRDLLDFTQARLGGGIRIEPRPADLHEVIGRVLDEVEAVHPGRQLVTSHDGDGRGVWDSDRIAQVVQNLVINALHYSPPETAVQVSTSVEAASVSIAVRNQGDPIAPEKLSRIFEPLQRGTAEVDSSGRSVGLGLYIVRQIVSAHGGAVEVHSTGEQGTTFTVRLPRESKSASAGTRAPS